MGSLPQPQPKVDQYYKSTIPNSVGGALQQVMDLIYQLDANGVSLTGRGIPAASTWSGSGTAPFWSDVAPGGAVAVWQMLDRVFIGAAFDYTLTRSNGHGGWIPNAAYGANWAVRDAQLGVMHTRGGLAVVGMAQSKDGDGIASGPATIGCSGFAIANSTTRSAWAGYFDMQYESGPAGYGQEIAVKNKGANVDSTPDLQNAATVGIWMNCGDPSYGGAPTNPNNAAIQIGSGVSGNTWNRGIVFFNNGLTTDAFGRGRAISLGKGHHISWYDGANHEAFYITSTVVTSGRGSSILVGDNILVFQNQNGQRIFAVQNADFVTANAMTFINGTAGNSPGINVTGTDTNVGLKITLQGTGTINLKLPTSSAGLASGDWWNNAGVVSIVP